MKILFLITKSTEGGAQTHISQLARFLIKRGDSVAVMSASGGWLENDIRSVGGIFIENPYFKNSLNPINVLKNRKVILNAVKDFNPDIVSCHSGFAGFVGRFFIRNKKPTIFTAHGWSFSPGSKIHQIVFSFIAEKIVSRWCEKIICVSDYDRKLAIKLKIADESKLVTIHNGVEIPEGEILPKESVSSIIFIGRLCYQKSPIILIKSLLCLPKDLLKKIKVKIVGDGPDLHLLKKFVIENGLSENVSLLGRLSRKDIFELLKKSDLFVLVSKYEGFPRSILEAMSFGLPIIASNVSGIPESVTSDIGFLLDKNTKEELAEKIQFLSTHPEVFKDMSINAKKNSKELFDIKIMCEKTTKIYSELYYLE